MSVARALSLFFAAGALGGVANSVAIWLFGQLGFTHALGVAIAPALSPSWLYPRIVWGGIWGILFALPSPTGWLKRGLVLSLGPSLVQLFVVFPVRGHQGLLGLELGLLTPLFVLFFNAVWGASASWWLRCTRS
ncbi:MAG: hypothetical protein OEY15_08365 [Myxococcales bacterium]|nr:hypothetical protein [Myxococcales bacterium]